MADKKRNGKKRTTETVKATIERLRGYNAGRLERIKELKKLINADNAKIRRLERLYGSINQDELREKIETMLFKDKKMTEEQIVAFIEQFYKETALDIPTDTTEKQIAPQVAEPDNEDIEDNEDGTE
jgi:hypothetical protein